MTDTLARMKQLIGSTAEWAASDIVLGYGEIGVEWVSANEYKAKVGDGTTKWSLLPYLSALSAGINATMQAALDAKLPIGGGTMTGNLILAHDGTGPKEAVTVTQLQNEATKLNTAIAGKLDVAGGSLTGPVFLSHAAAQPLEPVTFDQMTKAIAAISVVSQGGLIFAGTVDMTAAYAAPVPAPTSGMFYSVTKAGAVDPSWLPHMANKTIANVKVGDYIIWDATNSTFHHIANATDLTAYVPLAGTNGMVGNIEWGGAAAAKKGVNIIDGKGGTVNSVVVDGGTF